MLRAVATSNGGRYLVHRINPYVVFRVPINAINKLALAARARFVNSVIALRSMQMIRSERTRARARVSPDCSTEEKKGGDNETAISRKDQGFSRYLGCAICARLRRSSTIAPDRARARARTSFPQRERASCEGRRERRRKQDQREKKKEERSYKHIATARQ